MKVKQFLFVAALGVLLVLQVQSPLQRDRLVLRTTKINLGLLAEALDGFRLKIQTLTNTTRS